MTPAVFLCSIPVALTIGASAAQLFWLVLVVLLPVSGRMSTRLA